MISKIIKAFLFQDINALLFHGVLKRGWVQYAVFHLFHVNRFLETPYYFGGSDILCGIFTQLAGFIEKWPGFGNLGGHKLDDYIQGAATRKIICQGSANAIGRQAFSNCELLDFQGFVNMQPIAEHNLLCCRVNAE